MSTSNRPHKKRSISTVETLSDMGFTAAEIERATRAWVTPHDGDLVYLVNGQVPTATEGHIFKTEITHEITEQAANLQIVSQTGTVNTTIELETRG